MGIILENHIYEHGGSGWAQIAIQLFQILLQNISMFKGWKQIGHMRVLIWHMFGGIRTGQKLYFDLHAILP